MHAVALIYNRRGCQPGVARDAALLRSGKKNIDNTDSHTDTLYAVSR